MKNPQIKPHFRVEIVEPKTVYLLSEYATYRLRRGTGKLGEDKEMREQGKQGRR